MKKTLFLNGLVLKDVILRHELDGKVSIYKNDIKIGYMPKKFLLEDCGGGWYNVAVLESVLSQD